MKTPEDIFSMTLSECCDELFDTMPISARVALGRGPSGDLDNRQIAAVLGFCGESLNGTLTLRAPVSFFVATRPASSPMTLRAAADWAGETANQLLGRFKNKLVGRGVTFGLTTPATLFGEFLQAPDPSATAIDLVFPWMGDEVFIRLDIRAEEGLDVIVRRAPVGIVPESGVPLVF